jgi:threonine dehydratase
VKPIERIELASIEAARQRIAGLALRTPLIQLNVEDVEAEIYLKLENLQPIGSFKLRGAGNAMYLRGPDTLAGGVYTVSAGNMAQGVGWVAARMGVPFQAVVPEHAPETKLAAIERLGGRTIKLPFDEWWQVVLTHECSSADGEFIHPVSDVGVIAGNGTIALEILEDLPDVDAVIIPFGGGGLTSGIGSALRSLKPDTKIFACEVETAAPLHRSLAEGAPCEVDYAPSFVDGIGGITVLDEMWPLVSSLVDDSLVVGLDAVADAVRLLAERHRVVAEGAGAAPVAAALTGKAGCSKVVCVVSGGNIDTAKLTKILQGQVPHPTSK